MNNLNKLYCQNLSELLDWIKANGFSKEDIQDWLSTSNELHNKTAGFYRILGVWCLMAADIAAQEEKRA
jgi:hypothetical protein